MGTDEGTSTEDGNKTTTETTSDGGDKPKQITMTSEQLAERLARAKPADYDDLKAKAAKLDELEAANKSELDKAKDAVTKANSERDDATAEALRLRVAVKHGIGLEDADLFLTGRDEETLTAQAERLVGREADRKKHGNVVPGEGRRTSTVESDGREEVKAIFGGGD